MDIPRTLPELTALFEKLGAREPGDWAASQLEEGIPQLHRFLFLRQAWRNIVPADDPGWIDRYVQATERDPQGPYGGAGAALKRALAVGVSREDLTAIVRGLQAEFLFSLCYLLEDPGFEEPELAELGWRLFQTDPEGRPIGHIWALHESVLETDPTGREMRPGPDA